MVLPERYRLSHVGLGNMKRGLCFVGQGSLKDHRWRSGFIYKEITTQRRDTVQVYRSLKYSVNGKTVTKCPRAPDPGHKDVYRTYMYLYTLIHSKQVGRFYLQCAYSRKMTVLTHLNGNVQTKVSNSAQRFHESAQRVFDIEQRFITK